MSDYVQVSTRSLDYLERGISNLNNKIGDVGAFVKAVDGQLQLLKKDFANLVKEQRQQAALQRAITEIIRVRQEVEQKFGNHKQVRDNMLGILQATDSKLVTTNTISKCSEELMLSAPKYWLAPCLVAVAAWIADDEKLAVRAVNEAVKRDREKTCLLFALICRRNNRTEACFEWLGEYLKLQSPKNMKKSVIAFIDAYTNGVFGVDKDHVCDEHIDHWMKVLKQNDPNFDASQKEYWKTFFNAMGASVTFSSDGYLELKNMSPEFGKIDGFVSRITAVNNSGGAKDKIKDMLSAEVNMEQLIEDIDEQLRKLVANYEEGEETNLRDEETYLERVKRYNGNEEQAKREMALIRKGRIDQPIDFASRLQNAIQDANASTASKKTAIYLLKEYIMEAYKEYISENKDFYPQVINLKYEEQIGESKISWVGTTKTGENLAQMEKALGEKYDEEAENRMRACRPSTAKMIIFGIFTLGYYPYSQSKKYRSACAKIEDEFESKKRVATSKLRAAVEARAQTNNIVTDFIGKEDWDKINLKGDEE